jgi:acid phosphatase
MFRRLAALTALTALTVWPSPAAAEGSRGLEGIQHIVVIYEENHSFDNLYGGWEGVNGLSSASSMHTFQVTQGGARYTCLLQNDVNLAPLGCFANAPFTIDNYIQPKDTTCPKPRGSFAAHGVANGNGLPGGCTEDLVHRFYQEQYQLNDGAQNRYVTGSDAVGLTMGVYDTRSLPIYAYLHQPGHPSYAIADNFFQAAFGGSFLNHQWLIAARTPVWIGALSDGTTFDLHSVVDANGMPNSYALYHPPAGTAVMDQALTASCEPGAGRGPTPEDVVCGNYAVNTIQPTYQPYMPNTALAKRLPPLYTPTIGDRLSKAGVDWAWYAGGWSNANGDIGAPGWTSTVAGKCPDGTANLAVYPNCPDVLFQYHHQPFNYFYAYRPGTDARKMHLRDETEFLAAAQDSTSQCNLKPVSFVKPIGSENEHPGYTGENAGSSHLVQLVAAIENSACASNTMIVVTYDEFGGQWDHVTPPGQGRNHGVHDAFGPGTRVPALVIASQLPSAFMVDSTSYDTTSILATIERRFDLQPLSRRDARVNDLMAVFRDQQQGQN